MTPGISTSARVATVVAVCALVAGAGCGNQGRAATSGTTGATPIPARGHSPQTIRRVYGVTPLLAKGIDGRGETVVLPETLVGPRDPVNSNIRQDVTAFDASNHLRAADLSLGSALGFTGNTVMATSEEVQDVEMVHTIAPAAKLVVMLVPLSVNDTPADLGELLGAAARRGDIVSFSQSECETTSCLSAAGERSLESALESARRRHVSVFSSTGDSGAADDQFIRGVRAPATSPLVTAVGGTTLTVNEDGTYASESAWDDDNSHATSTGARLSGTGGGFSLRNPRPDYQADLTAIRGQHRGIPDVAAIAEPGMATVVVRNGQPKVYAAGGTSESTPLWAGIAALADQAAHRQLGFLNDALYRIGHSAQYGKAFHDVTHGNNTVTLPSGKKITGYSAGPGWDAVTGWGSPNAQVLVPLLGKEVQPNDGQGL